MAPLRAQQFSLLFLFLVVAELIGLRTLAPLDAFIAREIVSQRSCELDYMVFVIKDRALTVLIVGGATTLVWLFIRGRWKDAWHLSVVVLLGGFLCELLKTIFERPRPSVLSPLLAGNSFPSGHVTTAVLLAGVLSFVWFRGGQPRWRKVGGISLLGILVGATIWQRLYLGHHWCTDILGSVLLVGAWLCFALPRSPLFSFTWRSLAVAVGLFGGYLSFYFFPAIRFPLPSALSDEGKPVFTVSFGSNGPQELLHGAWGDHFQDPPSTWMNEEASIDVALPTRQPYLLKFAARPLLHSKAFACFPLDVTVNHQPAVSLLLYRGWREYSLYLEPRWLVPGWNTIAFRAGSMFPEHTTEQRTVAFHEVRLFLRKE